MGSQPIRNLESDLAVDGEKPFQLVSCSLVIEARLDTFVEALDAMTAQLDLDSGGIGGGRRGGCAFHDGDLSVGGGVTVARTIA